MQYCKCGYMFIPLNNNVADNFGESFNDEMIFCLRLVSSSAQCVCVIVKGNTTDNNNSIVRFVYQVLGEDFMQSSPGLFRAITSRFHSSVTIRISYSMFLKLTSVILKDDNEHVIILPDSHCSWYNGLNN
jgi:hypothetical protein